MVAGQILNDELRTIAAKVKERVDAASQADILALCDYVLAKRVWPKRDRREYMRNYMRARRANRAIK